MSGDDPGQGGQAPLRVLLCIGVRPPFFDTDDATRGLVGTAIEEAYDDLHGRFGITVIGTIDDDRVTVGPTEGWPWTGYILADAPDLEAVVSLCDIVRQQPVGDDRLWKYLKVEARVGRPLFFGNA